MTELAVVHYRQFRHISRVCRIHYHGQSCQKQRTHPDVHKYSTRQKHLLYVNKSNINVYAKSFGNVSVRVWNALQSKIDVNVPISKFKKSSKNYLQDNSLVLKYTR